MTDDVIEIHTSDRGTYKRCRRRFGWASTLRDNLIRVGPDKPAFFLGTGVHYALEDWWGYRRFPHPALAFAAYYDAQKRADLPDEAEEMLDLATGMLMYYADEWLVEHPEDYETLWVKDDEGILRPQVEVEIRIDITDLLLEEVGPGEWWNTAVGGKRVEYVCTLDRVVIDRHQRIRGVDYKSAAQFDEFNLQNNPQAGSYDWAMDLFYTPVGFKPAGIIWQQHKKAVPEEPKLVNVGKKNEGLSLNLTQATTYRLYRKALLAQYGTIPEKYNSYLAILAEMQDDNGDNFVRREVLRRNDYQREVEQGKIIDEVLEMLDPDLPLYPNPTKDCSWDCPFKDPCLAMDDGSDYQYMLSSEYVPWKGYKDDWRERIKYPEPTVAR